MAKKQTEAVQADTPTPDTPTPDNTPVPGGGSWRWDIAKPGWVEVGPDGEDVVVPQPDAEQP